MAQAGPTASDAPGAQSGAARTGGARTSRTTQTAEPAQARVLPPGQHIARAWPVVHYGPVPAFRPDRWDLRVCGATASGEEQRWDWPGLSTLPRVRVAADMHCVTKFTVTDVCWEGIAGAEVLRLAPPAPEVTHVMVWADFGYSANVPVADFAEDSTVFATHRDGLPLTPEHGFPVRFVAPRRYGWKSVKWVRAVEYMTTDRRGFWEQRGYHNTADPWREQRFSYQEEAGEGPPV